MSVSAKTADFIGLSKCWRNAQLAQSTTKQVKTVVQQR